MRAHLGMIDMDTLHDVGVVEASLSQMGNDLVASVDMEMIYQVAILIIFYVTLTFFIIMYSYSRRIKNVTLSQESTKREAQEHLFELEKARLGYERVEAEQEVRRQKNLRLSQEILLKNKSLATTTLLLNQHRDLMRKISETIKGCLDAPSEEYHKQLRKILKMIKHNHSLDDDWNDFKLHFEQIHPEFFNKLREKYPKLTNNDVRHCAYIRMGLSTKEIARLLNINDSSVQMSRVRIKKKMALGRDQNFMEYIVRF